MIKILSLFALLFFAVSSSYAGNSKHEAAKTSQQAGKVFEGRSFRGASVEAQLRSGSYHPEIKVEVSGRWSQNQPLRAARLDLQIPGVLKRQSSKPQTAWSLLPIHPRGPLWSCRVDFKLKGVKHVVAESWAGKKAAVTLWVRSSQGLIRILSRTIRLTR